MRWKAIQLSKLTSLLSLLFFALALWLLRRELADFHYKDILLFFHDLPAHRVVLALAFTALGYLALTGYDALALRYIGKRIAYWKVALASFTGYAFSNTLGLPLFTGTPLRARLYSGWGLTALDIARVVLFSYVTFWLGFIGLSGAAPSCSIRSPCRRCCTCPVATARPIGALFLGLSPPTSPPRPVRERPVSYQGAGIRRPPAADGRWRRSPSPRSTGRSPARCSTPCCPPAMAHHLPPLPRRLPLRPGRGPAQPRARRARGLRDHDGAAAAAGAAARRACWRRWSPSAPSTTSCRC